MPMNEMSGEACVKPKIIPVSSLGKKPFGITISIQKVAAIRARLSIINSKRKRRAPRSVRS